MALAVIPAIIVSFVVVVASLGTYYIYQAYRRVRFAVHDVERTRHIENVHHFQQQPIELHDLEAPRKQYHSSQWYGSEGVVLAHVAPAAKPLPRVPVVEYTGGEGLVSPPDRVFLPPDEITDSSKGRIKETDDLQVREMHAEKQRNFKTGGYGNSIVQTPGLLSPKPMRTGTRKPKAEPANTAYDSDQTAASEIWNKIEKRELQPSRRKAAKKLQNLPNTPVQEVLRDPSEFENDSSQDIDPSSSTMEWAKSKRPSTRQSFDSIDTVVDDNNANIERPQSYVKRKQNIGTGAIKPTQPLDRAAEARRQIAEMKKQMAERQKQEEDERLAEEQRQAEEQKQRAAEEQKQAEEKQRQDDDYRARSLAQTTEYEDVESYDTKVSGSRRPSINRKSNSSIESKRERKSRERPFARSPKRANTFANDAPNSVDNNVTTKKFSSSTPSKGNARSMSMNDQKRPDFNASMPSIAEGNRVEDIDDMHVDPFSDNPARRSFSSNRKSEVVSSMYTVNNKDKALSNGPPENPFASYKDRENPFTTAQRCSAASSTESRGSSSQDPRRSSNDSKCSSGSRQHPSNPKRNNSKSSARTRASVDSQSSQQSITRRDKPERKPSIASRALSKLSRKSSSLDKKARDSASSTQSWEGEGLGLRGGGRMLFEEPEDISSSSEDEQGNDHGGRLKHEEKPKNSVKMRGASGDKMQRESAMETDTDDESDTSGIEHSDDEHSNEYSSDDDGAVESEKHDSEGEGEGSDDRDTSEEEHSDSTVSDADTSAVATSEDESEDDISDDEHEQILKKPIGVKT
jgi:hypothetical protein